MSKNKTFFLVCALILLYIVEAAAEDITVRYSLPPMRRAPVTSAANNILKKAGVLQYAAEMPVNYTEVMDTARFVNDLRRSIQSYVRVISHGYSTVLFKGKTGSELNIFLKMLPTNSKNEVILLETEISLDEPVRLRNNTIIKGSMTRFIAKNVDFAFLGKDIAGAGLKDLVIDRPKVAGVILLNTKGCIFRNIEISDSLEKGIVIRGQSSFINITHSRFKNNIRGGIMVHDGSHHILIDHCDIYGGNNSSNWSAGVVLSSVGHVSEEGIRDAFDQYYFYPRDMSFKKGRVASRNIIEASHIHNNQSSGIYVDGGNGNVITGNYIVNNDKEGLCLDFYSVGNIVESNILTENGFRRFQSDDDLEHDAVLKFGRLADGSAASKLPNISLDNAAYNIIISNTISGAAGDGIKIVRSGFRNIFGLNSITDNNVQGNSVFTFFGILLGSAGSDTDDGSGLFDFLPSVENIIFGNTIYGPHKSGILIDRGSIYNDIYDNVIMKQKGEPVIELDRPNSVIGNNFNALQSIGKARLISNEKLIAVLLMLIITLFIFAIALFLKKRAKGSI